MLERKRLREEVRKGVEGGGGGRDGKSRTSVPERIQRVSPSDTYELSNKQNRH